MDELARTVAVPRFKRAADVARAVFGAALDLALPRVCAACREPVKGQGLCPACWSNLSFITRPYCERLGIPFVHDPGPRILSLEAIADPPAYQRSRAAVRFDDISRVLVHGLKYSDRLDPAPMMGRWLCHAGREVLAGADALVPVPLHRRRRWARRFNQSCMLVAAVSAASGVPIAAGALKRVEGDRSTSRAFAVEACDERTGRFPRTASGQGSRRRPQARPGRRRTDIGRDRGRPRARTASRRGRQCRRAGLRQGCRSGEHIHIKAG